MPIYALGSQEPTIASDAYIHPEAVIIGSVTIGSESTVWPCAVLRCCLSVASRLSRCCLVLGLGLGLGLGLE